MRADAPHLVDAAAGTTDRVGFALVDRPSVTPPVAERRLVRSVHHGIERIDDYAWLRAENWREVMKDPSCLAPDIRAHLEAENAYAEAMLAPLGALRAQLFEELKGRIKQDDATVPAPDGPFAYGLRYVAGAQHPRLTRVPRDGGPEETLLDAEILAQGKTYFRLGASEHSPDHRILAYGTDESGGEFYRIRFRDLGSGEDLPEAIADTTGTFVWALDGRTLFYVRLDESHRPSRVFRHALGTDPATDVLVYEEPDPGFFVGVGHTQSRTFVLINAHDHETSEVRLIDAARPEEAPRLVSARERGVRYVVEHRADLLVIRTNADGAEDSKIVTAPVVTPGRETWRDLVPHVQGRPILDVIAYEDHLVRLEREEGLPRIVVRRWSDGAEHTIAFAEEAYSLGLASGYEFATRTLRFTYSSPTTPARVFDYDLETRERRLRKEQEIPSGHDPSAYVARRILAPAPDGERVPVTVLHRKDLVLDGTAPCLLYGYGAYGITIPSAFNPNVFSLVDRGFVHATAHVRGGREKGERWWRGGKRENKRNTFTDFIAAAEHLCREGFTAPGRIIGQGRSAGGILIGAVANMRPDLFLGLSAEVPFVDVLNTMLDESLPLTPPEFPEWGDPIRDRAAYETIASYAPYENVRAQPYP
ncbi:MAG: S9 family peptidase, partial [Pseudomonadota bacterium]|nr:S9 family peptidase [Pseudomonadota bacterium]